MGSVLLTLGCRSTVKRTELLPVLREAAENAADGQVYLPPSFRSDAKNLRTTFNKLVPRAGLTPWTRKFANLRSTRATELAEILQYPRQESNL